MDATGWIPKVCDDYNIQGAWYCYSDGLGTSSCMTGQPPYVAASKAMCLSGTTSTSASAYGAAIGLELNSTGGTMSVKNPYNATQNNVVGFQITITGSGGGPGLRLTFTGGAATTTTQPFVELPGAGTYTVLLADAVVPGTYQGAMMGGTRVNPAAIYDVQLAVPANQIFAANYNYCITQLKPILAANAPTAATACGAEANYGMPVCAGQDLLGAVAAAGNTALYGVQNNLSGNPGSQCIQATTGGTCAGFLLSFPNGNFGVGGNSPSSYPSMIYGWAAGAFYGPYRTAKLISAINTVTGSFTFNPPPGGDQWDAAYDIWFSSTTPNPNKVDSSFTELMIWFNYAGGVNPATNTVGAPHTFTSLQGSWQAYHGNIGWNYVAFRRTTGNNGQTGVDLKEVINYAVSQGYMSGTNYLLGIQAGFELYHVSPGASVSTTQFSATVN
jgi:hypothetical protein